MMLMDDVFDPVWTEDSILAYSDALDNGTNKTENNKKTDSGLKWENHLNLSINYLITLQAFTLTSVHNILSCWT